MASNRIPRTYSPLVSLATDALDGATQQGAAVGLAQHTAPKIKADLVALEGDATATPRTPGAQGVLEAAKSAKLAATAAQRTAESNARCFIAEAIDVLKRPLGRHWNGAWAAAGFAGGSLAVPDDPLPVLGALGGYFAAHPAQENAPLGITAATCAAQQQALAAARGVANAAITDLGKALIARDTAKAKLTTRLSGLLSELGGLLGDDDPRWYAFGFERPADGEEPAAVTGLMLTPGGPGLVVADWDHARRADHYTVVAAVAGATATPVPATVHDCELTLTGLQSGQTVTVTVAGVNDAGEGPPASATVVVP